MRKAILFVTDHGDPSVGLLPETWKVESPIYFKDPLHPTESEIDDNLEDIIFFREESIKLYNEFADGKVEAEYEYEFNIC